MGPAVQTGRSAVNRAAPLRCLRPMWAGFGIRLRIWLRDPARTRRPETQKYATLLSMSLKIDQDHSRFRGIVRGKIRDNLRRYISQGELLGRKGKDIVSIPVPHIDTPRFIFGDRQKGGVGQGKGEVGDAVGGEQEESEDGAGQAGKDAGEHLLEVDVTLDEL